MIHLVEHRADLVIHQKPPNESDMNDPRLRPLYDNLIRLGAIDETGQMLVNLRFHRSIANRQYIWQVIYDDSMPLLADNEGKITD